MLFRSKKYIRKDWLQEELISNIEITAAFPTTNPKTEAIFNICCPKHRYSRELIYFNEDVMVFEQKKILQPIYMVSLGYNLEKSVSGGLHLPLGILRRVLLVSSGEARKTSQIQTPTQDEALKIEEKTGCRKN